MLLFDMTDSFIKGEAELSERISEIREGLFKES